MLNGNPFIKASEEVLWLLDSVLNASKYMGAKKIENKIADKGLNLIDHLMVQE